MQLSQRKGQNERTKNVQGLQRKDIDSRWVELKFQNNFTPRSYFASCIQAGKIYIHGGFNAESGSLSDFSVCNLYQPPFSWKSLSVKNAKVCSPGALRNHTLNSHYSQLILVGGQKNVVQNNDKIYRFDLLSNTWSICKCLSQKGKPFPFALDAHSSVIYKNFMFLIGGYDSNSTNYLDCVIKIDLSKISENLLTYSLIREDKGPYGRANSSCSLVNNEIYLFGGGNIEDVFDDLWQFEIESEKWQQSLKMPENITWPEKRKGATLVLHKESNSLFLFGGIKKITKQQNDINVFMIEKNKWVKIHSNTNQIYDPSPTVKEQLQSPTILDSKRKKQKLQNSQGSSSFNLNVKPAAHCQSLDRFHQNTSKLSKIQTQQKTQGNQAFRSLNRKMSVVKEKKFRQFLTKKKNLLSNLESGFVESKAKRGHSPTSEALFYSLHSIGQQMGNQKNEINLPKVIYDQQKGEVLGKMPCARDGHAGLVHQQSMIILGGDRHMVAFKDAYLFKMNKGIQSLPHYA